MYRNYTLWSKKEKKPMGHSILLASKLTTNYPLLPYKRIGENKNYKGVYKNELEIHTVCLKYNQPSSFYPTKKCTRIYRSTTHSVFNSSSHSSLGSASLNVCDNNPTLFLNQQWVRVKVKNQLPVQPGLSNHNENLQ